MTDSSSFSKRSFVPPQPVRPSRLDVAFSLLLFAFAFACYFNTLSADLLTQWDDQYYVTENPLIRDLSPVGLWQMWSQYYFLHYIPVTLMSYAFDYWLWGAHSFGYHLTNVLLHALNAILVYRLGCRLQPQPWVAALAAALFVVHPLQVESVAWVSERKNVLSLFFFLGAMLAHIRSRRQEGAAWLQGIAWGCYGLAVFSKPVVVCGPLLFMAYDYYYAKYTGWRAIRSSLPLLALSGFSVIITIIATEAGGKSPHYWQNSPWLTAQLMLRICWEYATSVVAPVTLNIRYTYALEDVVHGRLLIGLGLGVLTLLGYMAWRQPLGRPLSRFSILWIVAFMLPVANIIPFSIQRADRYIYFPSVTLFLLFSVGVYRVWQRFASRRMRQLLIAVVLALFLPLTHLTVQRNQVWANTGTVWRDHLKHYPDSLSGLMSLSIYYYEQKDYPQSEATLRTMLKYEPKFDKTYRYLGRITEDTGRYREAIYWFQKAIELRPQEPTYYNNLGYNYARLGYPRQAIGQYQHALALDPSYIRPQVNLARAALELKDYSLAKDALTSLQATHPDHPWIISSLCRVLVELDDPVTAAPSCREAVRIQPRHAPSLHALSRAYIGQGQFSEALTWAKKAVDAAPQWGRGYQTLGDIYTALEQTSQATDAYRSAETMNGMP